MTTFAERSQLIADLLALLKMSRRPVPIDEFGLRASIGSLVLALDAEGSRLLGRLTQRLIRHQHFEHRTHDELRNALIALLAEYQSAHRAGQRLAIKPIAEKFMDVTARPPASARVYFGVRHLGLAEAVDVGLAHFLPALDVAFLEPVLGAEVFEACSLYCSVAATGGTTTKLVERAEHTAMLAGSLLRLHLRTTFRDVHREQLLFDLHSHYAIAYDDDRLYWGAHRRSQPIPLDLAGLGSEWHTSVETEGHTLCLLPTSFRARVTTALEWMDTAARAPSWKTELPAIFSSVESLLVPEDCGHKAEVVTVRSVILQLVLGESFFDPADTYDAYITRCDLVHGSPVDADVTGERQQLAERCTWWAREILGGYITYASRSDAKTAEALARSLDECEAASRASQWFENLGVVGAEIVANYRRALGLSGYARTSD